MDEQSWESINDHRSLDFVVIGAQKAATTLVDRCLREHPQIFMPRGEVSYFEDPVYERREKHEFTALFSSAGAEKVVGIKRPTYLHYGEVPERLAAHSPDTHLIVSLRDPVDRAVSAYFHNLRMGFLPLLGLNEGMRALLEGTLQHDWPRSQEILDFGRYATHLRRYMEFFELDQISVVFFTDLIASTERQIKGLYSTLGVERGYTPSCLTEHPKKGVYSLLRIRLQRAINRVRYRYSSSPPRLHPVENLSAVRRALVLLLQAVDAFLVAPVVKNEKPALDADLRSALVAYYEDEVKALEAILDRRLTGWKTGSTSRKEE